MSDTVTYALPFGFLGSMVHALIVEGRSGGSSHSGRRRSRHASARQRWRPAGEDRRGRGNRADRARWLRRLPRRATKSDCSPQRTQSFHDLPGSILPCVWDGSPSRRA